VTVYAGCGRLDASSGRPTPYRENEPAHDILFHPTRRSARLMAGMRRKAELPSKTCPVCGRPFTWRRKWAREWENVRYCSERCRRQRGAAAGQIP